MVFNFIEGGMCIEFIVFFFDFSDMICIVYSVVYEILKKEVF